MSIHLSYAGLVESSIKRLSQTYQGNKAIKAYFPQPVKAKAVTGELPNYGRHTLKVLQRWLNLTYLKNIILGIKLGNCTAANECPEAVSFLTKTGPTSLQRKLCAFLASRLIWPMGLNYNNINSQQKGKMNTPVYSSESLNSKVGHRVLWDTLTQRQPEAKYSAD